MRFIKLKIYSKLMYLNIPTSLITIENNAFLNCNIYSITNNSQNFKFDMITQNTSGKVLYTSDNKSLIMAEKIFTGSYKILNGTENIYSYAFANSLLTNITIPQTILNIYIDCFTQCPLTTITLDQNNTNFKVHETNGGYVLYSKTKLLKATSNIFGSYTMLDTINNNVDKITIIDNNAFSYCYDLTDINFSNNLEIIYDSAFIYTNLTKITLPQSLLYIDINVFNECKINEIINNSPNFKFDIITTNTTGKVLYTSDFTQLILAETTLNGSYQILLDTQVIYPFAFAYSGLTNINIPNSIITIYNGSFAQCPLQNIDNTQSQYSYVDNTNNGQILYDLLNGVVIASTIKLSGTINIPNYIYFNNFNYDIFIILEYAFANTQINKIIISKNINNIIPYSFINCKLIDIELNSDNYNFYLDITSSGKILYSILYNNIVTTTYKLNDTYTILDKVIINNIKYPINSLYNTFNNVEITKLIIPTSITKLFKNTFSNMPNIKSITFNGNVPYVFSNQIFLNVPSLKYIYYYKPYKNSWIPRPFWIPYYIILIEIGSINTSIYYNRMSFNALLIQNNNIFKLKKTFNNISTNKSISKSFYLSNPQQLLRLFTYK